MSLREFLNRGMAAQKAVDGAVKAAQPKTPRCPECNRRLGSQHLPSCHRQGLVTPTSDYRDRAEER